MLGVKLSTNKLNYKRIYTHAHKYFYVFLRNLYGRKCDQMTLIVKMMLRFNFKEIININY